MNYNNYPKNWDALALRNKQIHGFKCELCGQVGSRKNPLTTHHIDGDTMNSSDDNLACLHASHHLLFHNTNSRCKSRAVFNDICKNFQLQIPFTFLKDFSDTESKGQFIAYKIRMRKRKARCSQNSLAVNS